MTEHPACLELEQPQHRPLTFVALSIWFGGLAVLIFALAGDVVRGIYAGLAWGLLIGFLGSLPERWVLEGEVFRQVRPRRQASQVRLSDVRVLEVELRLKGGFDLWLVPVSGYRVAVPTEPGQRGDAFRHELFHRLPADVLTRAQDPLILEMVAAAERSTAGDVH